MTDSITPVSAALSSVLAAGRAQFNARVAEARHRYPSFDAAGFAAFVRTGLDAVAVSVDAVAPERTGSVVVAAYDMALALVGQGLAGPNARTTVVERVWVDLAPRFARLLAVEPVEVLGALSNAAVTVASEPTARVGDWLGGMAEVAATVDSVDRLRALGVVIAWRAGLAHYRDAALRSADGLPDSLALAAVGAEPGRVWSEVRAACHANRWWSPQASRREHIGQGVDVGQFTGFGGVFSQPPTLRACRQGFVVRSGDRFCLLVADAQGAVLLPASAEDFAAADAVTSVPGATLSGSDIVIGARRFAGDLPDDGLALVGNEHSIAVTSPYTHAIRLLPRVGSPR